MRPNFKNINITSDAFATKGCTEASCQSQETWMTPELIPVKSI